MLNMFAWLLVGHLVGDFLLQTGWMSRKTSNFLALFIHSLVYTLAVILIALPAGGLGYQAAAVIFFSHLFLDQRGFVLFWVRTVNKAGDLPWFSIVVDQCFHIIILAVVAQYLS